MGGSFDVIAFIDVDLLIKNVTYNDKVDSSITALVLHLIQPVYPDEVALWVFTDIVGVALNYHPQFYVLLSAYRLHDYLGIVSIIHKTTALAF
jgi:hypothetical protein